MSDPNMIMNFANNQPQLLTGIGQGLRGLGGQLIQQEVTKKNNVAYKDAQDAWDLDPSKENYRSLMAASRPLGIYDQTVADIEGMDAITQKNRLTRNGQLIASAESNGGDPKYTLQLLEEERDALIADGEEAEAKGVQSSIDRINEGDLAGFSKDLQITTGILTGGQDFLENYRAQEKHTSDQIMTSAGIFKIMEDLSVDDIEERSRLGDLMEGMSLAEGKKLSEMIQIAGGTNPKDMTPDQFAKLTTTFRKEYYDNTAGFRANDVVKDKMQASLDQNTPQGDVGALFLFMKMLDENSVVRESEFRTASQMGSMLDRVKNAYTKVKDGGTLQPGQADDLRKITTAFYNVAADKRTVIDDRMHKNTAFFGVPDDLVFLDYDTEGNEAVVEEKTDIVSASNVTPQAGGTGRLVALRAHVKASNPQSTADFDNMTEEQLNKYNASKTFVYEESEGEFMEGDD